jgi:O-antigen/teichoic acid export membrane protein
MPGAVSGSSKRVLSQGLLTIGAQLVNSLVTYFSILIIINALGEFRFGMLSYTMVISAMTMMIADFGMNPIILRTIARKLNSTKQIILEATVLRFLLLVPTFVLTNIVALVQHESGEFFLLVNIMLLNTLFSAKMPIIRGTLESFFRAESRMSIPTILALADSLILLGLALLCKSLFTSSLSAMIAYTLPNLVGFIALVCWSFLRLRSPSYGSWRMHLASMKELMLESAPMALFLFLNAVHTQFDSVYIDAFFTKTEVGIYGAAFRLTLPLLSIPTMVGWAFVPFIARLSITAGHESKQRIVLLYSIGLKSLALLACAIAVLGYFDSSTLVQLAFRGAYGGAVAPLMILLGSYPFVALNLFQVEMNTSLGYQKRNTVLAFIMMMCSLVLGYVFVQRYGINGAAWTKTFAVVAGFLYLFTRFQKDLHWRYGGSVVKLLIILAVVFASASFIPHHFFIVRLFAVPCLFLIGSIVTGYFNPEELALWKTQIRSFLRLEQSIEEEAG